MGGYKSANYNSNLEQNLLDMDVADIMTMLKRGAKRDQRHIISSPKTYIPQGVLPPPFDPSTGYPLNEYPLNRVNPYETPHHSGSENLKKPRQKNS